MSVCICGLYNMKTYLHWFAGVEKLYVTKRPQTPNSTFLERIIGQQPPSSYDYCSNYTFLLRLSNAVGTSVSSYFGSFLLDRIDHFSHNS